MSGEANINEKKYFSQFEAEGYYERDVVYLQAGAPSTVLLKKLPPIIHAATNHLMQSELEGDAQLFQYGLEKGNWHFCSHVATFLSKEYGDTVHRNQLFLTGGASSGLWLALSCLFPTGSLVFVEDPSYFCALKVFTDLKMRVIPVKTDENGLVIDDLHNKLVKYLSENSHSANPPVNAMLYTIPTYHNPTTSILPEDRCKKVIQLARKYRILVICDDVYNLLHYDDLPIAPKRLFAYDTESDANYVGNVISNGSFSKFLGPGLRLGWMEAPNWAIKRFEEFGVLQSGGGLNTYTAGLIASLIALGKMDTHLQLIRNVFKTNMLAATDLLSNELPVGCTLRSSPRGGYFLWIELPENISGKNLVTFAKAEYQVSFMCGQNASPSGGFSNCIRICVAFYPLNVLTPALRRLCQAIADFQTRI